MYKKLISLILVLAFVGVSSAGSALWNPNVQVGNWEDASNWTTTSGASLPPGPADFAAPYPPSGGYTAVTINLSSYQSVGRVKWQFQTSTLNINSDGTLLNNGSVGSAQMYGGTSETININNGGAFIAQGSGTGLQTGSGSHTINIQSGGLLGCYGTTSHLATSALGLGTTSAGGGSTTINVYYGGVLDVDSITLANTNQVINLHAGGVIYVWGILNGSITPVGGILPTQTVIDPVVGSPLYGMTVNMYGPEPASALLLGIGAVFFGLRRKQC